MGESITIQIRRYRPEDESEPVWESFEVPRRDEWMILDGLNHIKDRLDGSLSYRWACRMGVCGSCGMVVNGKPVLTCATYLSAFGDGPIRVEPIKGFPVIRDLVVDMEDFVDKLKSVKPWIIR
jgi:fumarate reductase iron-sulfur subunit